MTLPHYAWLANEPARKMLLEALKLHGVHEAPGSANDATIMGWAAECGLTVLHRRQRAVVRAVHGGGGEARRQARATFTALGSVVERVGGSTQGSPSWATC